MAGLTAAAKEAAALAVTGAASWVSLHTADPGTTGASEVSGGSYARAQTTWSAGISDGIVSGSEVTALLAAGTYTHVGLWSASTGGTFYGSVAISPALTFVATTTVTVGPTITAA